MQTLAYALAQFGGGGFGESHHQYLARQQSGVAGPTVADDQAQIQRGQRPGFARARAGFNHLTASQGQAQRVQGVHADSCSLMASSVWQARNIGPYNWSANCVKRCMSKSSKRG